MKRFEYIGLLFDYGDLSHLNSFSSAGWRVVSVNPTPQMGDYYALLEREVQ